MRPEGSEGEADFLGMLREYFLSNFLSLQLFFLVFSVVHGLVVESILDLRWRLRVRNQLREQSKNCRGHVVRERGMVEQLEQGGDHARPLKV